MNLADTPYMLDHTAALSHSLPDDSSKRSGRMKRRAPNRTTRRPFTPVRFLPLLLLLGLCRATTAGAQQSTNAEGQTTTLQSEMDTAIQQVQRIVNQPVARYTRTARMHVASFKAGWFHEGASKPDFNTVDVRTSQEAPYEQYPYITSDLNPGVVFVGRQCEFNGMTKYFYLDRSVPKKRLTEAEMVEINRLYRIIGRCELQLARLRNPAAAATASADASEPGSKPERAARLLNPYAGGALLFAAVLVLYFSYKRRTQ